MSATATTAAARAGLLRNLDFTEGGFGAQQMLQRTLLIRDCLLQLALSQILGSRLHRLSSFIELGDKSGDVVITADQFTRTGALYQALRLFRQRLLQIRQQRGVVLHATVVLRAVLYRARQIKGRHQDFALPVGDAPFLLSTAATAATTTGSLRLRIATVKRLHLNEE